jgi:hypothetical protein
MLIGGPRRRNRVYDVTLRHLRSQRPLNGVSAGNRNEEPIGLFDRLSQTEANP